MSKRTLMQRLLDERPASQEQRTWEDIVERLEPTPRRWLVLASVLAVVAVTVSAWLMRPVVKPPDEMYLFISSSDRPASEALEFSLKESP